MQNLTMFAIIVLKILRQKIYLERREQVIKFGYLPPENGSNFKNMTFMSSPPKIDIPPCQFQQFSSRGICFHLQKFGTSQ